MKQRVRWLTFVVLSFLMGSAVATLAIEVPASASSSPVIGGVVFAGGSSSSSPIVTVSGQEFGQSPPTGYDDTNTSCGSYMNNGDVYGSGFNFTDNTNQWSAGGGIPLNGNCVGLVVQSWSTSKVVFAFGSSYGSFDHWTADLGDNFTLTLEGATATGPVSSNSHTLSVSLAATGAGNVSGLGISCPGTCSDSYPSGMKVRLTAVATSGSSFARLEGRVHRRRFVHNQPQLRSSGHRDVHRSRHALAHPRRRARRNRLGDGDRRWHQLPGELLEELRRGDGRKVEGRAGVGFGLQRLVRRRLQWDVHVHGDDERQPVSCSDVQRGCRERRAREGPRDHRHFAGKLHGGERRRLHAHPHVGRHRDGQERQDGPG
jgi:hypothetical protein